MWDVHMYCTVEIFEGAFLRGIHLCAQLVSAARYQEQHMFQTGMIPICQIQVHVLVEKVHFLSCKLQHQNPHDNEVVVETV
jgi:hypothetical protein